MALTITKTKAKPKAKVDHVLVQVPKDDLAKVDPTDMSYPQLADAYGSLEDMTDALLTNPAFARFKEVSGELSKRIAVEHEPDDELTIKGEHWHLDVGAAAHAPAEIKDMALLRKFVGDAVFMQIAKVTLTDCKKYLNPEQLAQVLNEDTGYTARRKIVAKFMG